MKYSWIINLKLLNGHINTDFVSQLCFLENIIIIIYFYFNCIFCVLLLVVCSYIRWFWWMMGVSFASLPDELQMMYICKIKHKSQMKRILRLIPAHVLSLLQDRAERPHGQTLHIFPWYPSPSSGAAMKRLEASKLRSGRSASPAPSSFTHRCVAQATFLTL